EKRRVLERALRGPGRDRRRGGVGSLVYAGRRVSGCWKLRIPAQLINELRKRLALDELHGVVIHAALSADTVNRDDVGMVQLRGRVRFILETLELLRIKCCREGKHF